MIFFFYKRVILNPNSRIFPFFFSFFYTFIKKQIWKMIKNSVEQKANSQTSVNLGGEMEREVVEGKGEKFSVRFSFLEKIVSSMF